MRLFQVSDEVGEWIDRYAAKEGSGGFQDKAAEIKAGEIFTLHTRAAHDHELRGIDMAIQNLQALLAAHEDEAS